MGGGGGVKSFSCQTKRLSWVEVKLGLWQQTTTTIMEEKELDEWWMIKDSSFDIVQIIDTWQWIIITQCFNDNS